MREKRLTGRFALPNKRKDIYTFNMFGGIRGRSQNWEGCTEIGRANLLVSRIMMFAIIDQKNGLVTGVYKKRLTGRFALPNKKKRYLWF